MNSVLCSGRRVHGLSKCLLGNHTWIFCVPNINPTCFPSLPSPYHLPPSITSTSVKSATVFFTFKLQFSIIFPSPLCLFPLIQLFCSALFFASHMHSLLFIPTVSSLQRPLPSSPDHYSSLKSLVPATLRIAVQSAYVFIPSPYPMATLQNKFLFPVR